MDAEKLAKEWLDRKVKHPENTTRKLANFLTRAIEEETQALREQVEELREVIRREIKTLALKSPIRNMLEIALAHAEAGMGKADRRNEAIAFMRGAKWWEYHSTKGTMWQSDQETVADESEKRYGYKPTSEDFYPPATPPSKRQRGKDEM